jgi:hypothetical protein
MNFSNFDRKISRFRDFSSYKRNLSEKNKDEADQENNNPEEVVKDANEEKPKAESGNKAKSTKSYGLSETDVNPGNPSQGIAVLSEINKDLEKRYQSEVKDFTKKIKQRAEDEGGAKTELEQGMTPFGSLKDVVKNLSAWASNYSSSSDEYSFWKDEEDLAKEEEAISGATQDYLGISLKSDIKAGSAEEDEDPELADILSGIPGAGFNRSTQKLFSQSTISRLKANPELKQFGESLEENIQKYGFPKFQDVGIKKYEDSIEFSSLKKEMGLAEADTDKILAKLKKCRVPELPEAGSVIVCIRPPRKVKNSYPNSFSDLFLLIQRDGGKLSIKPMLGSSTPAPAFRYRRWVDIFSSTMGLRGLLYQGGSFIAKSSTYKLYLDSESEKSKYYGTPILYTKKEIDTFGNFKMMDDPRVAASISTYSPGKFIDHAVMLSLCPSLVGGGTSEFLDATTSGDLVIQNYSDFQKIIDAVKKNEGSIKVFITEDPGNFEEVEESRNLKYIKRI